MGVFARLRVTESAMRLARVETLKEQGLGNGWKRGRALRSLCAELKKEKWAASLEEFQRVNPSPLPSVCPLIPLLSYPTLLVIVKCVANNANWPKIQSQKTNSNLDIDRIERESDYKW
jgi:hypothetical protein